MNRDLILHTRPLTARLLADDPHARSRAGSHIGGLLGDDELEAGHALQAALKGLARLEKLVHALVAEALVDDDGVVGGLIEEWRVREVPKHRIGMDALRRGAAPLDLVKRRALS